MHTPYNVSVETPKLPTDPQTLSIDALEGEITTLAASIAVATWRLLKLIAELDAREPWGGALISCAHWLNWKCGIALGAAREKVRVAHAMKNLPLIDTAFAAGELSYSKVRAMTRVATPENQDYLLMIARHGTAAHLEKLVRAFQRVKRLESARMAYAERAVHCTYEDDGSMLIRVKLPAEQGALVLKAIEAAVHELRDEREGKDRGIERTLDVSAETSWEHLKPHPDSFDTAKEPIAAWRADALCHITEQFLANDTVASRQAERFQILVHMNHSSQAINDAESNCRIANGPAIADETARRLSCDASLVRLHEDTDGNVLDIGRRTRSIPPALRRALQHRDGGCRFPGCLNHRYVDAHHIHHWADGGATRIDNLVLLCRHHHRLLHEEGFRLERRDDGRPLFFRPDGQLIPHAPQPAPAHTMASILDDCGVDVAAETCVPRWYGERMNLNDAVGALLNLTPFGDAVR